LSIALAARTEAQRQSSLDTPIPTDMGMVQNLVQQSSDSLVHSAPVMFTTNSLGDRPSPILTSLDAALNNPRNRLINLQPIQSNISQAINPNGLPSQNGNNGSLTNTTIFTHHGNNGSLSFTNVHNSPPLLSRHYSHNNFVQQNHDFQRLLSISPPLSPSLTGHNTNQNHTHHGTNNHSLPQFLEFRPPANQANAAHDHNQHSNENNNSNNNSNTLTHSHSPTITITRAMQRTCLRIAC